MTGEIPATETLFYILKDNGLCQKNHINDYLPLSQNPNEFICPFRVTCYAFKNILSIGLMMLFPKNKNLPFYLIYLFLVNIGSRFSCYCVIGL